LRQGAVKLAVARLDQRDPGFGPEFTAVAYVLEFSAGVSGPYAPTGICGLSGKQ